MGDIIKMLLPLLIEAAKAIIDKAIVGEKLKEAEIKTIQTAYVAAKVWLQDVVTDTVNTYDDAALEAFLELCEDTANEGNFKLPDYEE